MRMTAGILGMLLLSAACSSSPVIPGPAGFIDPGEVTVDFFQEDRLVGRIHVRSGSVQDDFVRLLVQVPIVPGEDYRLDSLTIEFLTDVIQPVIALQAADGTLMEDISFSRTDSTVTLSVSDTGAHGDGTIVFEFLASEDTFGSSGLRLHASLQLRAGDAETNLLIHPAP